MPSYNALSSELVATNAALAALTTRVTSLENSRTIDEAAFKALAAQLGVDEAKIWSALMGNALEGGSPRCEDCGAELGVGRVLTKCGACHNAYVRRWRANMTMRATRRFPGLDIDRNIACGNDDS